MALSLWQLNEKIEQLIAEGVDRETGEISEEVLDELEAMEIAKKEKVLNWGLYIKGERAEAEAVQRQADILAARAKQHKARASSLEHRLDRLLEPGERFRDDRVQVYYRKSSFVDISHPSIIPDGFMRQKPPPPPEPDKTAIRAALTANKEVPGARIVERHILKVE